MEEEACKEKIDEVQIDRALSPRVLAAFGLSAILIAAIALMCCSCSVSHSAEVHFFKDAGKIFSAVEQIAEDLLPAIALPSPEVSK